VQEYQAVNFPFFVDVRPDGMNREQAIVAGLPAVTLNWVSPVVLDEVKNTGRQTGVLLTSSPNSWLRTDTNINPSTELYPDRGYPVEGEMLAQPLAVVAQGVFTSYFTDKPSPFAVPPVDPNAVDPNAPVPTPGPAPDAGALTISSDGARLVVIGSGEFLDDAVLQLMSSMVQDQVLNNLQLVQNAIDWSVEDTDLLSIRARGTYTRLLDPINERQQTTWEVGNYIVALLALLLTGGFWYARRRNEQPMTLTPPTTLVGAPATGD